MTKSKLLIAALLLSGLSGCSGDLDELEQKVAEIKSRPGERIEPLPEIKPYEAFTYNASNLLGVIAALRSLGVSLDAAVQACRGLQPPPGRMEFFGGDAQPLVVVDYAHTPDAIEKVLQALRPLAAERGGRLACVFGCGGDRDPAKRPLMGAVAARFADGIVITSDNPRSESPAARMRIASSSCSGGVSFTRNPAAPARSAANTCSSRSNVVRMRIAGDDPGSASRMRAVAPMPSRSGMRMSMSTTSGRARTASSIASRPFWASPTTLRSG